MTRTPQEHSQKKISLPVKRGLIFLDADDIIYISSVDMWVNVITLQGNYQVPLTIKFLCAKVLPDFVRTHRSYLVNPVHILKYQKRDGTIFLTGDLVVPVSRRRRKWVENELKLIFK